MDPIRNRDQYASLLLVMVSLEAFPPQLLKFKSIEEDSGSFYGWPRLNRKASASPGSVSVEEPCNKSSTSVLSSQTMRIKKDVKIIKHSMKKQTFTLG